MMNSECRMMNWFDSSFIIRHSSFILFVQRMAAATATKLLELQPIRRVLLVLRRHVVPLFALSTLQNNVISRHTTRPLSFVLCP